MNYSKECLMNFLKTKKSVFYPRLVTDSVCCHGMEILPNIRCFYDEYVEYCSDCGVVPYEINDMTLPQLDTIKIGIDDTYKTITLSFNGMTYSQELFNYTVSDIRHVEKFDMGVTVYKCDSLYVLGINDNYGKFDTILEIIDFLKLEYRGCKDYTDVISSIKNTSNLC